MNLPHRIADRSLMAIDALERIECHIAGHHLEQSSLRLEGVHGPGGPHHVGERHRMGADVGADVDHGVAQLDVGPDRLDFEVTPFAVEVESTPDEGVVAAVHEEAMAAVLDRDMTV